MPLHACSAVIQLFARFPQSVLVKMPPVVLLKHGLSMTASLGAVEECQMLVARRTLVATLRLPSDCEATISGPSPRAGSALAESMHRVGDGSCAQEPCTT